MKTTLYMLISKTGAARVFKKPRSADWDEIPLALTIDLPDQLFRKPRLQANIAIPADAVCPVVIEAAVADHIAEILYSATGLEARVTIEGNPPNLSDDQESDD